MKTATLILFCGILFTANLFAQPHHLVKGKSENYRDSSGKVVGKLSKIAGLHSDIYVKRITQTKLRLNEWETVFEFSKPGKESRYPVTIILQFNVLQDTICYATGDVLTDFNILISPDKGSTSLTAGYWSPAESITITTRSKKRPVATITGVEDRLTPSSIGNDVRQGIVTKES